MLRASLPSVSVGLLIGCISTAVAKGNVYGFGSAATIESGQYLNVFDTETGKKRHIGAPLRAELAAQQLSSIDPVNKVYYMLDLNVTSNTTNLIGLSLTDGTVVVNLKIDVPESTMFIGVGQYLAADASTGCVVIAGLEPSAGGYRVIQGCPFSSDAQKWTTVTTVKSPLVALEDTCSVIDSSRGLFYALMPVHLLQAPPGNAPPQATASGGGIIHVVKFDANVSTATVVSTRSPGSAQLQGSGLTQPPPPLYKIELVAVSIKAATLGQVYMLGQPKLQTLAYDSIKKRVVGLGNIFALKTLLAAPIPPAKEYATIGIVKGFDVQMGPISAVDSKARVHYAMMGPSADLVWKSATDCSPACNAGTSCCHVPAVQGSCFNVTACSDLDGGGGPTGPFYFVGLSLDNASMIGTPPYICSIVGFDCPWGLEVGPP